MVVAWAERDLVRQSYDSEMCIHRQPSERKFEIHLVHLPKGCHTDTAKLVIGILYHKSATADSGGRLEALNKSLHKCAESGLSQMKSVYDIAVDIFQ